MNNVDFAYYEKGSVNFSAQGLEPLATIQADGTCVYDWAVIKKYARLWKPGTDWTTDCTDWDICLAKLLMPFAPKEDS